MTLDILGERLSAAPFASLTIHLADGRFFHIDHPDFAVLLRMSHTLVLYSEPARVTYIDVGGIITLETTDAGVTA